MGKVVLLIALTATLASAQGPRFDVASIRVVSPDTAESFSYVNRPGEVRFSNRSG